MPYITQSVNGSMLDTNKTAENKNEFLFFQQAICQGNISRVWDVVVNDALFLDDPTLGSDHNKDTYADRSKAAIRIDINNDTAVSNMIATNFNDRSTAQFTGAAHASVCVRLDRDNPQMQGVPDLQFLVEGRVVRQYSALGVLASTGYTNNPAWCLLDYLMDARCGKGLLASEIDFGSFYSAASVCDTIVDAATERKGRVWDNTSAVNMSIGIDGTNYTNGTFTGVPLVLKDGTATTAPIATIIVSGNKVTSVDTSSNPGVYVNGATFTAPSLTRTGDPKPVDALFVTGIVQATHSRSIDTSPTKLYECNIVLDTKKTVRENVEILLSTMGDARLVWSSGKYKLSLQYPQSNSSIIVSATINDDNLVHTKPFKVSYPSSSERLNRCTVRFHNEAKEFKEDTRSWPKLYSTLHTQYVDEDYGLTLESDVFADGCTDALHALAKAEELVRISRGTVKFEFSIVLRDYFPEPGDVISLSSASFDVTGSYVKVEEISSDDQFVATIKGSSFDASMLAWNADDDVSYVAPKVYRVLNPRVSYLEYVAYASDDSSGYLVWPIVRNSVVSGYSLYYNINGQTNSDGPIMQYLGTVGSNDNTFRLPKLDASGYTFAIRAVATDGSVGSATTTGWAENDIKRMAIGLKPPTPTNVIALVNGGGNVDITWTVPGTSYGSNYLRHQHTEIRLGATLATSVSIGSDTRNRFVYQFTGNGTYVLHLRCVSVEGLYSEPTEVTVVVDSANTDLTPPPAPTAVSVIELYTNLRVSSLPSYTQGGGHYSTIVRAAGSKFEAQGNIVNYVGDPGNTYGLYVSYRSKAGVQGPEYGPVYADTGANVTNVISTLNTALADGTLPGQTMTFAADTFAITGTNSGQLGTDTGAITTTPFYHVTTALTLPNGTVIPPGTYLETAYIADATIVSAKIKDLTADKLTAGTIDASVITVNNLNADNLVSGTITGRKIRTAATGARIEMSEGSPHRISGYDSTNVEQWYLGVGDAYLNDVTGNVSTSYFHMPEMVVGSGYTGGMYTNGTNYVNGSLHIRGMYGGTSYPATASGPNFEWCQVVQNTSGGASNGVRYDISGLHGVVLSRTNPGFGVGSKPGALYVTDGMYQGPAIHGENTSTSGDSVGIKGSGNNYDFYASGSGTNYGPFTGGHDGLTSAYSAALVGDIIVDQEIIERKNVSNTIFMVDRSTLPSQRGVVGVLCTRSPVMSGSVPAAMDTVDQYVGTHDRVTFNAVGEGQINVVNEGGDFAVGDLIVSSSTPGKGMRQSDDIVRSYTVAKIRESVQWNPGDPPVKMVACIYLCG
jgi:Putative phage tail protein